ncbi:hypothetical protein N7462_007262 [Penicillium macrosclerotiorum]|uniref:uncharacterized protein n=1 Tax=Penicillium macrosclerotiorum TaxID=303699 RepID=UPI0025468CA6|nr:uncharacterized protein N7462_007262 [Penicillium macrosclerotiorum]KAJ5679018.1 hypothetical protein N7462_007262 [Penicillium macrosclerotiorum]
MTVPSFKVLVVGAGPAGLLLALMLSRKGIQVTVLEAGDKLNDQPRATHYSPPAVYELRRAGVLDDVRAEGFTPNKTCWRKLDGTVLAELHNDPLGDDIDRTTCLPLNELGQVLVRHLRCQSSAEIRWSHTVRGIGQNDHKAWVSVETLDGEVTLEADYIVGCDGANSRIRKSLHGDSNFPGETWEEQVVATNVYYDFDKYGYEDANYIIDKEHWHVAARITKDGLWRVSYGEDRGLSQEELVSRQPMKFLKMLPGNPSPEQYKLANFSPYRVHQRLAVKMREGRFLLAADAAHLCNPLYEIYLARVNFICPLIS